jgi:hypothetical protein
MAGKTSGAAQRSLAVAPSRPYNPAESPSSCLFRLY